MKTYRYFMFDDPPGSPPKFFKADECILQDSDTLGKIKGNEPVKSWMFYVNGLVVYEIPVRMMLGKPVAVSAEKANEER